ncbi:MAG: exopolysaccharide biosynthesis polyprenyl glycosylphosphotransferase [Methylobacteriaceae bacterium]|nr:exopolysaccharide biosynthesis polyprenyl glycosylphosphotransferase [Methylobacteriaceae bacterium]
MTSQSAHAPRERGRAMPAAPRATRRKGDWTGALPSQNAVMVRLSFGALAMLSDIAAIIFSAAAAGVAWHGLFYDGPGETEWFLQLGLLLAVLTATPNLLANHYTIDNYVSLKGHLRTLFLIWNTAFLGALALAFLTKTSAYFSRGTVLIVYVVGFAALSCARAAMVRLVRSGGDGGVVLTRRIFLVGRESEIDAFLRRFAPRACGMDVVAAAVLREGDGTLADDLALAAASARMLRPDDVFVLAPWSDMTTIEATVNAFLRVPAAIHLGPEQVLHRFDEAHIARVGSIQSLFLVRRPLNPVEVVVKRGLDLVIAATALVVLSPLLAFVALAIRLDAPGPVIFAQRRYGFNQEPFRIFKFRSMRTLDDGATVPQVSNDDPRVTRVGRWIRRFNIDELPQLFNVLRGEMSLVGPRPHALAHDQAYERRIAFYARRHNVRPGITGWAQVNGLRGETDTDEKMRARVEHDLHYIDNWSLLLDFRILLLTIFSPKAYVNAR